MAVRFVLFATSIPLYYKMKSGHCLSFLCLCAFLAWLTTYFTGKKDQQSQVQLKHITDDAGLNQNYSPHEPTRIFIGACTEESNRGSSSTLLTKKKECPHISRWFRPGCSVIPQSRKQSCLPTTTTRYILLQGAWKDERDQRTPNQARCTVRPKQSIPRWNEIWQCAHGKKSRCRYIFRQK